MLLRSTIGLLALQLHSILSASIQFPFQQPGSKSPSQFDIPYRELEWGQVNIIHTTDTHGWLLGHQREEASFSGDWGDLYSFVTRMKAEAKRRGVDLLIVDSGDRVDGNGLVDAEPEGHVKGWSAMKFFTQIPYDIITTGNHELYKYPVARSTLENIAEHYGQNYITSNVNVTLEVEGVEKSVPLGNRFRKFTTEQGRRVTALGPLFNFKAHAPGTTVQPPSSMILEPWFLSAIQDAPDFFLLVGHMSLQKQSDSQWTLIFNAIRELHPKTPILIFGGHHHIRDCKQEDNRSMSLASGRYMETVGWMSVSGFENSEDQPMIFSRRYLDQNRNTYRFHAGKDFDTDKGQEISRSMTTVAASFNLTRSFGIAPHSYYLYRYPATSEMSILNLMTSKVLPLLVDRPDLPYQHVTILNTGSIRFDIFKGPFTRNDQWIILPFTNNFLYIRGIDRKIASQLLPYLNVVGEHGFTSTVESIYQQSLIDSFKLSKQVDQPFENKFRSNLTWGYVTQDSCGGLGDDILHLALPAVEQPIFVATDLPAPSLEGDEELIDVVFFDFIQIDIILALNYLQKVKVYSEKDVGLYITTFTANTLMQEYALREWN